MCVYDLTGTYYCNHIHITLIYQHLHTIYSYPSISSLALVIQNFSCCWCYRDTKACVASNCYGAEKQFQIGKNAPT